MTLAVVSLAGVDFSRGLADSAAASLPSLLSAFLAYASGDAARGAMAAALGAAPGAVSAPAAHTARGGWAARSGGSGGGAVLCSGVGEDCAVGRPRVWWAVLRLWGTGVELPARGQRASPAADSALRAHSAAAFASLLAQGGRLPAWRRDGGVGEAGSDAAGQRAALGLLHWVIAGPCVAYLKDASQASMPWVRSPI